MISGSVNARREAIIPLTIRGSGDREESIEVVVDTGFNGDLTCPSSLIARLDLAWHHSARRLLADGSEAAFAVYEATILWDGTERLVAVDEVNASPMIGMRLLDGFELAVQVHAGGSVTIKALPGS
jgi:clan AA aspartic protease